MFRLVLVTADKKLVSGEELEEITVPGYAGELNILPGHAPLLTTLLPGIVSYRLKNGETNRFAVSGGYCQVSPEGVNVLVETAVTKTEINVAADEAELKDLEKKIVNDSLDDHDWNKVQMHMERLKAEINLATGG